MRPSPFSLLQHAALTRVLAALIVIAGLWLAIHWAVVLP
jgi:hypothetical protein